MHYHGGINIDALNEFLNKTGQVPEPLRFMCLNIRTILFRAGEAFAITGGDYTFDGKDRGSYESRSTVKVSVVFHQGRIQAQSNCHAAVEGLLYEVILGKEHSTAIGQYLT